MRDEEQAVGRSIGQPPAIPMRFWGNAYINGELAQWGTIVRAEVEGWPYSAQTFVDAQGHYGYDPIFMIETSTDYPTGATVKLYVGGIHAADYLYAVGGIVELNLYAVGDVGGFLPGSTHQAMINVQNPTSIQWTYKIRLLLGGTVVATWHNETLAGGASRMLSLPVIMPSTPGVYDVAVSAEEISTNTNLGMTTLEEITVGG